MKNYIFTAVLLFLTISLSAQPIPKYKDASQPIEVRVQDLLRLKQNFILIYKPQFLFRDLLNILLRLNIHAVLLEFRGSRLFLREGLLKRLFPRLIFQIAFSQGSAADMDYHSKTRYDHRDSN